MGERVLGSFRRSHGSISLNERVTGKARQCKAKRVVTTIERCTLLTQCVEFGNCLVARPGPFVEGPEERPNIGERVVDIDASNAPILYDLPLRRECGVDLIQALVPRYREELFDATEDDRSEGLVEVHPHHSTKEGSYQDDCRDPAFSCSHLAVARVMTD